MKFVMEFEVDNAFFHSEPYYNGKQKKATLDMSAVGMLVADYGRRLLAPANGRVRSWKAMATRSAAGESKGGSYEQDGVCHLAW